ncbi:hypothetical protein [Mannheimia pernigra]|uniref:hypothetical protein n=1 Tax=Mannheimia pernigra TaxID=111844 RepID=UPI00159F4DF2|nr:hypothetical protein [Mannheimia pernigra]QLB44712.1 hypothetical protein HV561_08135 [Mannheimia pernigra]
MWTVDNIEDVVFFLWLFVISPIMGYLLYDLASISIFIWLLSSIAVACIITFFTSPLIMIFCLLFEAVMNLLGSLNERLQRKLN